MLNEGNSIWPLKEFVSLNLPSRKGIIRLNLKLSDYLKHPEVCCWKDSRRDFHVTVFSIIYRRYELERKINIKQASGSEIRILAYEGRYLSVTRRFESDAYEFVELDETRKSLKGFVVIPCTSCILVVLLHFPPMARIIWINRIMRFWLETFPIDSSHSY
jgi:hypothetical protein